MKILLLSAYHADSHKQWCHGLIKYLPQHQWTLLSLPPRHFAWRVRGNSLSWAFTNSEELSAGYDLLVATSVVDLAALRGFIPALTEIPTLVYFHENQFEYPRSDHQLEAVEPQIVNLYSALCADRVVFNSAWNRDSFLTGVTTLLGKLPDHVPNDLPQRLLERSRLLPVGLDPDLFAQKHCPSSANEPPLLVWNHRWEYDKGPGGLLAALRELKRRRLPFRLDLLGPQFRQQPEVFKTIQQEFANQLGHCGYQPDRASYLNCLRKADFVLSTARHDFQGLAVLEAAACGALPIVPNRLAYPEFLPARCLFPSIPDDPEQEASSFASHFASFCNQNTREQLAREINLRHLGWDQLGGNYAALFRELAGD